MSGSAAGPTPAQTAATTPGPQNPVIQAYMQTMPNGPHWPFRAKQAWFHGLWYITEVISGQTTPVQVTPAPTPVATSTTSSAGSDQSGSTATTVSGSPSVSGSTSTAIAGNPVTSS